MNKIKPSYTITNPRPIPCLVNDYLSYDCVTGDLTWKKHISNKNKKGYKAGFLSSSGYLKIVLKGINYRCHRIAWFLHYGEQPKVIDHINGCKTDNRIENLRSCTQQQNTINSNTTKISKSGRTGVSFGSKTKTWRAQINYKGRKIDLGRHKNLSDAVQARQKAEIKYFGEYRCTS